MIITHDKCISKMSTTGRLRLSLDFMEHITQLVFQQKHALCKNLLPRKIFPFKSFFLLFISCLFQSTEGLVHNILV